MVIAERDIEELISGSAAGRRGAPMYRNLAERLREAIAVGDIAPGARLPSERRLAETAGVSRVTVVAAYELLREEGLVTRRQGSGTRVVPNPGTNPWLTPGVVDGFASQHAIPGEYLEQLPEAVHFGIAALAGSAIIAEEAQRFAERDLPDLLRGFGYSPHGYLPLREMIAERYRREGLPTSVDQLLLTSGAQQAISMLAMLLVPSGAAAAVEDPTYVGALDALRAVEARILSIPVDASGARPEYVADHLRRAAPHLVYLVATYHNPTGAVLSDARRHEILELIVRARCVLVDDRSLADLSLGDAAAPPPLATLDDSGLVITVGSLSKLTWGGLRLGWIRGPEQLIRRLARLKLALDHGSAQLTQALAVRLLGRLDEIVAERRTAIRARYEALDEALRADLRGWTWSRPAGGLSLWARLPAGDASEFAEAARRERVVVVPGSVFSAAGQWNDRVRLPYGDEPATLREGVRRLAAAWSHYEPAAARRRPQLSGVV